MTEDAAANTELHEETIAARLVRARESAGLTRAQIAAKTRIPERHLIALEAGDFSALPGRTYALGFSRSYAKVVGLNEAEVADAVRAELAGAEPEAPRFAAPAFEPGDPARVPSGKLAWISALAVVAVVILGFFIWPSIYSPGGSLPSLLPADAPQPAASTAPAAAAPAPANGPVVFTAREAGIWVKFYDGAGNQLMQKQMAQGESWTVPDNVPDVKLWTARPEALAITIGGRAVPPLSDVQRSMKDVPVTAAALLARGTSAAPVAAPTATVAQPVSRPAARRSERSRSNAGTGAAPAAAEPAAAQPQAAPAAPAPAPAAT